MQEKENLKCSVSAGEMSTNVMFLCLNINGGFHQVHHCCTAGSRAAQRKLHVHALKFVEEERYHRVVEQEQPACVGVISVHGSDRK